MRRLLFLLVLACVSPAFGQSIDEVRGFRDFKFGSRMEALPKGAVLTRDPTYPKLVTVELPAAALKERIC